MKTAGSESCSGVAKPGICRGADGRCDSVCRRGGAIRHARGFSLLELMAVLILIAIAVTIASVSFANSLSSARVQAVSRDLVAALRYTRGQAIVKGQQKTLDVDLEDMSYTAPGKSAVKFPDKVEIKLLTAQNELIHDRAGRIRFYPDGSSTGGHVSVIAGTREWRVNVGWLTGEVDLEELKQR